MDCQTVEQPTEVERLLEAVQRLMVPLLRAPAFAAHPEWVEDLQRFDCRWDARVGTMRLERGVERFPPDESEDDYDARFIATLRAVADELEARGPGWRNA
ncbi:MAG TPA: hypothetical protein VGG41_07075 [Solirubrobacteraceae bacterium]|jgi:hypothetical protein